MTAPRPQDLAEHAVAASTAHDCVAIVSSSSSANLRWANNTLTTNGETRSTQVSVIAFDRRRDGTSYGSATGSATSVEQVDALVEQADAAARAGPPAEDAADLVRPDADRAAAAGSWDAAPELTSIDVYAVFAPALGRAFRSAAAGGRILYGFVDHQLVTTYLASTTGLRLRHVQPTGHYGCTAKTVDLSTSSWVGGATRDFTDVDAGRLEHELAGRLAWARRRVELPAGRYDTILPPTAVADLMVDAYWAAGARVAHDGQSVFSRRGGGTRVGERVASPGVHLRSDPGDPRLTCSPFVATAASSNVTSVFDNGLPLGPTDWIDDGVLSSLVQTRHSARLTGQPVTPAIDNLLLEVDGAEGGVTDLVSSTERGLLLTCLWYIREVDPQTLLLTGLTRDGVYLVEDGEVVAAVNNFRFNESPVSLLGRFSQASATVPSFGREWGEDYFSRTATPALRVPDFHMSSVSPAL